MGGCFTIGSTWDNWDWANCISTWARRSLASGAISERTLPESILRRSAFASLRCFSRWFISGSERDCSTRICAEAKLTSVPRSGACFSNRLSSAKARSKSRFSLNRSTNAKSNLKTVSGTGDGGCAKAAKPTKRQQTGTSAANRFMIKPFPNS